MHLFDPASYFSADIIGAAVCAAILGLLLLLLIAYILYKKFKTPPHPIQQHQPEENEMQHMADGCAA